MKKRGSIFRGISAIIGSVGFLVALYFLDQEMVVEASISGVLGVLLITLSIFPFVKTT